MTTDYRVLYLPIIETGSFHATALQHKRGLYDALTKRALVTQLDYLDIPKADLFTVVLKHLEDLEPDLLLTQLHGWDSLTVDQLRTIRQLYPSLTICNWSGDSWSHGLTSPKILELCTQFDWQLVAAPDVLPIYEQHGIRAAYWQIAHEPSHTTLPDMPSFDVVFLGNVISDKRRSLLEFLNDLGGVSVGIYGDWEHSRGHNTYDFPAGEALYKNAKVAIADMAYVDQTNYVSNRPIQILMAGGALLLHQHVPKMQEMMGFIDGQHYLEWETFAQLEILIRHWIKPEQNAERAVIVDAGKAYAAVHHTYEARVEQLFTEFLPQVQKG